MALTKPVEILELNGAFKHEVGRRRPKSPKSHAPFGSVPAYMTDTEKDCWRELVANAPYGVLTGTDRPIMEVVTRLLVKFRANWLPAQELSQLTSNLARLGWTPADRSRITTLEQPPKEEFDFLK